MRTFSHQIGAGQNNNLNAIRLVLALAVILSHAFALSLGIGGEENGEPLMRLTQNQASSGFLAVNLFFFISGLLITSSWLRSKSMSDYLMKRVLRIYPGYIVALGFSGFITWLFCPVFVANVGHGISWSLMLARDFVFLQNNSITQWKGIFPANPYPNVVNGSLWTIPIEFNCYLVVAAVGLFCLFKHRLLILLATVIAFTIYAGGLWHGDDIGNATCRFFTYFLIGMCAWLWRDIIPFSKWIAIGAIVSLSVTILFKHGFEVVFPFAGTYCLLWLGYGPRLRFFDWTAKTDLSYGTYLYAFPIQQVLASYAPLRMPWINFAMAVPVTLLFAWGSWHLVERRFLKLKTAIRNDFDPGMSGQM